MADQKHSRAQSSSIPSKSLVDFVERAKADLWRATQRAMKSTRNSKKQNKRASGGSVMSAPGKTQSMPIAAPVSQPGKIGLADHEREFSYVCGTVYIGNGTLGTAGVVYFKDLQGNLWTSPIPVLLRDTDTTPKLVPVYGSDVTKYFAQAEVLGARVEFQSKQPSTTNAITVITGVLKGTNSAFVFGTGTPSQISAANALSASASARMAGYQSRIIDLMPFVAGGFGPKQRIFQVTQYSGLPTSTGSAQAVRENMATFLVAGAADTAFNGFETHDVIIRLRVRLMDFIGMLYAAGVVGEAKTASGRAPGAFPAPDYSGPVSAVNALQYNRFPGASYHWDSQPGVASINNTGLTPWVKLIGDNAGATSTEVQTDAFGNLKVSVLPDEKKNPESSKEEQKKTDQSATIEGPIPGPPPLKPIQPTPSTSVSVLHSAAKQMGFVLIRKGDVNTPGSIKDDHFEKPPKA